MQTFSVRERTQPHMDTQPHPWDVSQGLTWYGVLSFHDDRASGRGVVFDQRFVDKPGRFTVGLSAEHRLAMWLEEGGWSEV